MSSATLSSRHYFHLLAPGPAGVEGRFVREILLSLDGISVGGQSTIDREGSHVILFSLSLVEEKGQVLPNGN